MTKKRLIIWGSLGLYLIIALVAVSINRNSVVCNNIEVSLKDSSQAILIDSKEVIDLMEQISGRILGEKLSSINLAELEDGLNRNALIKNAELFKTIDGVLKVNIQQCTPIVRIYTDSLSYYIDNYGNILPLPKKYRPRVLFANGNIQHKSAVVSDIYHMAKFISSSRFWNAQIEQIYVNNKKEFELVPRVGAHTIYFGTATEIEKKFKKLMALYQYGFQTVNWNKYKIINLKFKNQVVCVK